MRRLTGLVLMGVGLLAGCAAVQLNPGSAQVRITTNEPQGCKYLGEVTGNQGNFFTGGFTSNANLETGARNEMKNEAAKLGANTVQMLTNRAGQTGSMSLAGGTGGGSTEQTNVTYTGIAYKCPEPK
nr:DUF4156 domain-containing protein [Nitrospirota bacterium]